MWKRTESFFIGADQNRLFFQNWIPEGEHRSHIIITHGQGEHSESYHRVIKALAGTGVGFSAWDLRGHGRSDGQRGYAHDFEDYILDFYRFLDVLPKKLDLSGKKIFHLAHSLGGLIELKALCDRPELTPDGLIISSPLLGVSVPVPGWKSSSAKYLAQYFPKLTLGNEINYEMLTRDAAVIEEYEKDPLRHSKISSGVFIGFLNAIETIKDMGSRIACPAVLLIPSHDPVINSDAAREFFQQMPNSQNQLFVYPEGRHELFNDINRVTVFEDLKSFLKKQGVIS